MVNIAPFIHIINAAAQAGVSAPASNGLVARQTLDPNQLPLPCRNTCQVINTIYNCGSSLSCMCASSVGSSLQSCMDCLVYEVPSVTSAAQNVINTWNQACNGNLSLNPGLTGGSTGDMTSGTPGGQTSGIIHFTATSSSASPATTSSSTSPATTVPSSGGSSGGGSPPGIGSKSGAVSLKTVTIGVCVAAAAFGAFMTL